ncbi:hypothetical protein [Angelakisella massiliensis]|uniref:hypothetical protein n=1 Tax=Angelakisella massiliensis TaxID=1871018 RepID=UPI0023A7A70C|nr:hypothetical protein [Angelakisella massiliensis]
MKKAIRTTLPPCVGASIGAILVQAWNHLGVWGLWDILFHFLVTFLVTTLIMTLCIWIWNLIRGKK